jgi:hypothetical protein
MWNQPVAIFEDEDEDALKSEFIRLTALHPSRTPDEIAGYVFRKQRDPGLRSAQAAMVWLKDIDVLERIRQARLNGGVEAPGIHSLEDKLRKLQVLYEDESQALKDRLNAMRLHAEMSGQIVKAIDAKVSSTDKVKPFPTFVIAQYADD